MDTLIVGIFLVYLGGNDIKVQHFHFNDGYKCEVAGFRLVNQFNKDKEASTDKAIYKCWEIRK